jgi:hypothetical protein
VAVIVLAAAAAMNAIVCVNAFNTQQNEKY